MIYDVMLKRCGGWSSIDSLDKRLTREEYLEDLKDSGESELIREVSEAEDFKVIKRR